MCVYACVRVCVCSCVAAGKQTPLCYPSSVTSARAMMLFNLGSAYCLRSEYDKARKCLTQVTMATLCNSCPGLANQNLVTLALDMLLHCCSGSKKCFYGEKRETFKNLGRSHFSDDVDQTGCWLFLLHFMLDKCIKAFLKFILETVTVQKHLIRPVSLML